MFTGDLTQKGEKEEFDKFDDILSEVWKEFDNNPLLLVVPGNHDLVRPPKLNAAAKLLKNWDDPEMINEFCTEKNSEYRDVLNIAFKNYVH